MNRHRWRRAWLMDPTPAPSRNGRTRTYPTDTHTGDSSMPLPSELSGMEIKVQTRRLTLPASGHVRRVLPCDEVSLQLQELESWLVMLVKSSFLAIRILEANLMRPSTSSKNQLRTMYVIHQHSKDEEIACFNFRNKDSRAIDYSCLVLGGVVEHSLPCPSHLWAQWPERGRPQVQEDDSALSHFHPPPPGPCPSAESGQAYGDASAVSMHWH
ncbi:hypothetical protein B0J13DRAFT_188548 [Dactylonectria estremocensis]|uniref:Uncharacterized protein n=1 Tax=Dactylonectria estremocensis TaxID=1079267 RepID=A0A9P9FCM0_9HYPO|nr:hypothetical protein B0J13DRAFT_188548 [Dactylonectria estremocensis]